MANPPDVFARDSSKSAGVRILPLFLTMFATALAICFFDLADARYFVGDVDDLMREIQIRQLMSPVGDWWNLTLPVIAMPEPYVSPWSRLVDLPYVVLAELLSPLMGKQQALSMAFDIWPPALLAIFCLQSVAIYRRFGIPASLLGHLLVIASTLLGVVALWEFVPARIDHHNLQMIALMTVFCGLSRWDRLGGLMIGCGSLVSVVIALEGLPFIVVAFAGLVGAFLLRMDGASMVLERASAAMFVLSLPLALALLGPFGLLSTQCDAYSAPYIVLVMGFSAILWCASTFFALLGRPSLFAAMTLPAVALLAAFAILFPQCLGGPYWMIDPVSKTYWLDRLSQEHSVLHFVQRGANSLIILSVILGSILTLAAAFVISSRQQGRAGVVIMLAVAWAALILTLLLNRYIRFAFAFSPLFLPLAVHFLLGRPGIKASAFVGKIAFGCIAAYFVLASWVVLVTPLRAPAFDAVDYMSYDGCPNGDFSTLAQVPPGRIVVPQGLSMRFATSMPPGFTVASVPFHRASPGMKRVFEAFVSTDSEIRRQALQPFDYIAACRFPLKPETGEAPLYDALSAGGDWPGLIRVPSNPANTFQLFRIDHEALR